MKNEDEWLLKRFADEINLDPNDEHPIEPSQESAAAPKESNEEDRDEDDALVPA